MTGLCKWRPIQVDGWTSMADSDHKSYCDVWVTLGGHNRVDNTRKCTCGVREKKAAEKVQELARHRALRPLGMTDAEFLLTLKIQPEES